MCLVRNRSDWLDTLSRQATERPGTIAAANVSVDGEITRSVTWKELMASAQSRARSIADVVRPGETVLVACPSGIELVEWFVGAIASGTRLVLMHPRSGAGECAEVCARADVKAVFAEDELLTKAHRPLVRLGGWEASRSPRQEHGQLGEQRPGGVCPGSIVLGSSGTTGLPKLVQRESEALDADARAVAGGLSLTPSDQVLCVPPLCHSYGIDMMLGTLFAGGTLRIMGEFDPAGVARQIACGVTVLPGMPFVYEALARLRSGVEDAPPRARDLRLAVCAGSPLSARVRDEFTRWWGVGVGQLYGATELGAVSVSLPGEAGFDPESVGRPLAGVSFRVVDIEDPSRELAPGEEGHLAVKASSMLSGYLDETLSLADGHLLTGDLARIDRSGRATITGRLKLMIDAGGYKVNPLEVEATLLTHPAVAECAVVPLALSATIQRLLALVVAKDPQRPPTNAELRGFLRERLSPTKVPRQFRMVASLPRSPQGKLQRHRLPKEEVS